jgi:hypothetical protein
VAGADRYLFFLTSGRSNPGRGSGIGRPKLLGREGAAALTAGALLRGGTPPELAELGFPRADSSGVWVGKGLRDTRSPPGAFAGLGEAWSSGIVSDGGAAAVESAGECGRAPRVHHTRIHLAQKGQRGLGCLPRLEIEQGGRAGAAIIDGEWRGRCGARERAAAVVLWAC